MKKLSIYVHIPFCEKRCYYCDFASTVKDNDIVERYVDAVIREIKTFNHSDMYVVDSIFFGGGTPTCIDSRHIERIVNEIYKKFNVDLVEFTIEGNPNSYTLEKVKHYKSFGVNRLSVGVQSLNDKVLKAIGRLHDERVAKSCIDLLVNNCENVSVDMMIGLPFQTKEILQNDLDYVLKTGISHLSCYSLILEEGTLLYNLVNNEKLILPSEDETVDMYDIAFNMLTNNGLNRYEISNFGKPCYHNQGYWNMKEYQGFGLSSHSLVSNVRYYNTSDMKEYLSGKCYIIEESLSRYDMAKEYVMLALRCDYGVSIQKLREYGEDILTSMLNIAKSQDKYLCIDKDRFYIDKKYTYISNSIMEKFL